MIFMLDILLKKKNIFFFYLIKFINTFSYVLKFIRLKIFVDYIDKLDNMLKVCELGDIQINPYTFVFIQIKSMLVGCFISIFLFGFDVLFMFCFGFLFLILPYLKIYEQYNKIINEIIDNLTDYFNLDVKTKELKKIKRTHKEQLNIFCKNINK